MPRSIRRSSLLVACLIGGAMWLPSATPDAAPKGGNTKAAKKTALQKDADAFLTVVTGLLQPASTAAARVDWVAATDVTPEHTAQRTGADKTYAAVAGSKLIIERTKALLENEKQLDELTVRQLRKLLLAAAEAPGTIPEVVSKRIELESKQSGDPRMATPSACNPKGQTCAKPITANGIDELLNKSRDLNERQRVWTASKEIGRPLRPGLVDLVKVRNQVAREMGYESFFALRSPTTA